MMEAYCPPVLFLMKVNPLLLQLSSKFRFPEYSIHVLYTLWYWLLLQIVFSVIYNKKLEIFSLKKYVTVLTDGSQTSLKTATLENNWNILSII